MQDRNEKMIGVIGTTIFHVGIVLFLLFIYLTPSTDTRAVEWGGVPVMFGNVPDAFGDDEPFGRGGEIVENTPLVNDVEYSSPEQTKVVPTTTASNEGVTPATQDMEETIAIDAAEKKRKDEKKQKELAEIRIKEETDRKAREADAAKKAKADADAKKKQQIGNQMAGLFGNGEGDGSRGNTHGTGTQGVPTGNASFGKTSGVGGWGSFDLGGRSLGSGGLVKPSYSVDDYGTVVVDIVVNPQGGVVEASIGRGTNTPSAVLKEEALRAARRTTFNAVSKAGNQSGKITYKFNLN